MCESIVIIAIILVLKDGTLKNIKITKQSLLGHFHHGVQSISKGAHPAAEDHCCANATPDRIWLSSHWNFQEKHIQRVGGL